MPTTEVGRIGISIYRKDPRVVYASVEQGLRYNAHVAFSTAFELINVWWPRTPDLPWYQNYGVLLVTVILAVLGIIAYMLAPRQKAGPSATTARPAAGTTTK